MHTAVAIGLSGCLLAESPPNKSQSRPKPIAHGSDFALPTQKGSRAQGRAALPEAAVRWVLARLALAGCILGLRVSHGVLLELRAHVL